MGLPCCHGSRPALRWCGSAGSRSGACPKEAPNDQGLVRDNAQAAASIQFVAVGHGATRKAAFARLRPPVGRTVDDVFGDIPIGKPRPGGSIEMRLDKIAEAKSKWKQERNAEKPDRQGRASPWSMGDFSPQYPHILQYPEAHCPEA